MAHVALPPVPSAARIILPRNQDTALFILRSVQSTRAHERYGGMTNLAESLWEPPPNQGPFYGVYREWSETNRPRNIGRLVDTLLLHYGVYELIDNPYPSIIQALARQLRIEKEEYERQTRLRRDVANRRAEARGQENEYQEGALGALPGEYGVDAPRVRGVTPIRQMEIQGACAVLAANPISQNSHARPVILPPPPQLHDDTQQRRITPVNNEDQEAGNEFGMMPQEFRPIPPPLIFQMVKARRLVIMFWVTIFCSDLRLSHSLS